MVTVDSEDRERDVEIGDLEIQKCLLFVKRCQMVYRYVAFSETMLTISIHFVSVSLLGLLSRNRSPPNKTKSTRS